MPIVQLLLGLIVDECEDFTAWSGVKTPLFFCKDVVGEAEGNDG